MMGLRFSLAPLLALLVFAMCGGIIWLAHIEAGEMTVDRRPPLVKAAAVPIKRSPDDPGGQAVADLGGIGDLLSEQPAETEEQLLPRPEQPLTPAEDGGDRPSVGAEAQAALEALVSEIQSDRPDEDQGGLGGPNTDAATNYPAQSRPQTSAIRTEPLTPEAFTPSEGSEEPAAETKPAEVEVAAASPVFEASAEGRYRVQLAAVREEADAKRAWDVFQQQLGPFISGLKPFFERAETSNGVFYRVQIGPFAETTEADRLCVELKKQDASCFVVSR